MQEFSIACKENDFAKIRNFLYLGFNIKNKYLLSNLKDLISSNSFEAFKFIVKQLDLETFDKIRDELFVYCILKKRYNINMERK